MDNSLPTIQPESMEVANTYLETLSLEKTADALSLPLEKVTVLLRESSVKSYIDTVFAETGYRNRHKLGVLLDRIVESKLEEAEETGQFTNKDLLDVLQFIYKISSTESPRTQTNVQVNNYASLMEKLV